MPRERLSLNDLNILFILTFFGCVATSVHAADKGFLKPSSHYQEIDVKDNKPAAAMEGKTQSSVIPKDPNQVKTSERCNTFLFDATGSYDTEAEELSFLWDFGDGTTSTVPIVEHSYQRSGQYQVRLTITDGSGLNCSTSEAMRVVKANIPPTAHLISAQDNICVNDTVEFDASSSFDDTAYNLKYTWDFGDGTSEYQSTRVTKTFTKGGRYTVKLTVDDGQDICNTDSTDTVVYVNEPPVAKISEDEILRCVSDESDMIISFDGTQSSDPNNDPLQYKWDFGDGITDIGAQVTHQFAAIGNYDVKLLVSDPTNYGCSTGIDFVKVRLNRAPIAEAGNDVVACPNDLIMLDGSQSYAHKKGTLDAKWDFGDGKQASGLVAKHAYKDAGKYTATLTVENQLNKMCLPSKDTTTVYINTPPTVKINAAQKACLDDVVTFEAQAEDPDNDELEYYWSFGDGSVSRAGAKVTHKYSQGGTYKVSVIVDDSKGSSCSTATADTTIRINTQPIADAGANLTCCVDKKSIFDATNSTDADGDTLSYYWDFGDGQKLQGASVNHTYKQSGSYKVTLTVNDQSQTSCSSSTDSFVAQVNTAPVAVIDIR